MRGGGGTKTTQITQEVLQCQKIRNKILLLITTKQKNKPQQISYICYIGQAAEDNNKSDF